MGEAKFYHAVSVHTAHRFATIRCGYAEGGRSKVEVHTRHADTNLPWSRFPAGDVAAASCLSSNKGVGYG